MARPVFVEFKVASTDRPPRCEYFLGRSLADILADTDGGTQFAGNAYISYREVSEEQIRSLPFVDGGEIIPVAVAERWRTCFLGAPIFPSVH